LLAEAVQEVVHLVMALLVAAVLVDCAQALASQ
jgi:hypothetical protein